MDYKTHDKKMEQRTRMKAEFIEFFSSINVSCITLDNYICLDLVVIGYIILVLRQDL